jgi:hypothetical protein
MSDDPIMDATAGYDFEADMESHKDDKFEKEVKDALGLPEAPASATVRVYIDDFSTLITVRGTEASDVVRKVEFIVDYAKKKGWKSTWTKDVSPTSATSSTSSTPSSTPTCPVHNRPMKLFHGKWGDFYKCTAKTGEDTWCNEKVNLKK